MIVTKLKRKIIIAGPCGAETKEQMDESIKQAKQLQVDFLRVNLWKPRTKPGFEGLKNKGIEFMVEAAKQGIDSWIKQNHSAADYQWYPPSELVNPPSDTPTPTPNT